MDQRTRDLNKRVAEAREANLIAAMFRGDRTVTYDVEVVLVLDGVPQPPTPKLGPRAVFVLWPTVMQPVVE